MVHRACDLGFCHTPFASDLGFSTHQLEIIIRSESLPHNNLESKNVGPSVDNVGQPKEFSSSEQNKGGAYTDRAAERRSLHGGFGVGPGQKKSADDIDSSYPVFDDPEDAAAEALNMSFGVGSYARRLLENMGWKEIKR